jgi:hemerythrin-like domain-containing protein
VAADPSERHTVTDVIALIKAQHQQIDRLLSKAEEGDGDVGALVQQVADLLIPHSQAEEDFVYPTIKRKTSDTGEDVADAVAEHHQIEGMIQELLAQEPGDPGYDGTLAAVTAELRHHVEEEEQELLPVLKENSSAEELQQMGQRFAEATGAKSAGGANDLTRDELYERAKQQGVSGRSEMTKQELAEAVDD